QQLWNADSSRFYCQVSGGSLPILFDFNGGTTLSATRRGTTLNFFADIAFHNSNRDLIYGPSTAAGATGHHTIVKADVSTIPPTYTILLNLEDVVPGLAALGDTYVGTVDVHNNTLMVICGGTQDTHRF